MTGPGMGSQGGLGGWLAGLWLRLTLRLRLCKGLRVGAWYCCGAASPHGTVVVAAMVLSKSVTWLVLVPCDGAVWSEML